MAVFKIFPEKTTTIYSFYPTLNVGSDEILDISTFKSVIDSNESSRILLKFNNKEINEITTIAGVNNIQCNLKLSLAHASSLPIDYTIYSHPISRDWNIGTGKLGNSPITTDGAGWYSREDLNGVYWLAAPIEGYETGSYSGSLGGGIWYTSSLYQATQSFTKNSNKDINLDVSDTVKAWYNNNISNNGFIIKHNNDLEFEDNNKFEIKYFSGNTHTIYPPCLEIKWDDSSYTTGSLGVIETDAYMVSIGNNKAEYQQDSIQLFNLKVKPKYPPRTFNVSSFNYTPTYYILPETSYWSIIDLDTKEIIIDYDIINTKISGNNKGNYFKIYMSGMQPERYYKILIKTILPDGSTIIYDENYYFKIIR